LKLKIAKSAKQVVLINFAVVLLALLSKREKETLNELTVLPSDKTS